MNNETILNEIMLNAREVPLECQERILDILKGMAFAKKCLIKNLCVDNEKKTHEKSV
ncbi:hypothetical protein [Clostridium thailandense]|uniref:hypothetical protein n=1 Tax=Clostridium thailandense TaxID=2794346 RepID=UPI0039895437